MVSWLRGAYTASVFSKVDPPHTSPNDILASLFHRSSATLYFIYALWGIVSFYDLIPTLFMNNGQFFSQFFSLIVAITAGLAAVGAAYFPRTGRMEMYAGLAVVGLITFYVVSLFLAGLGELPGRIPAAIYGTSHLVVPIARTVFVYKTLVHVARPRETK